MNRSAINIPDINTHSDFWLYLNTSFPDLVYPLNVQDPEETGNVFRFNKIVQHVRLRQVRVKPQPCKVPRILNNTYVKFAPALVLKEDAFTCFPPYSASSEDRGIWKGTKYTTAEVLGLNTIQSSYSMGGFVVAMDKNNTGFKKKISELHAARWTDDGTRAVFLDFAAYNPTRDVFISVRILFEFLPYGSVVPRVKIRAFRNNLEHPPSSTITSNLVIEIGLYFSCFLNFFRELGKLLAFGLNRYLRGIWNIATAITLLLLLGSVVFRFLVSRQWRQLRNSNPTVSQWKLDPKSNSWDVFWDWDFLGYCNGQIVKLQAIALVCAWIRWFGFIKFFNHRIDNFVATLASAKRDILTSCFILVALLLSFAISFHSGYGEESALFATFDTSMLTLCQIILANFNAGQITSGSGLLANVLVLTFSTVLTFYSANVVLAVLWWSSDRVVSGQVARESDNPEENLKDRIVSVLTSWMSKYTLVRRICSPVVQLLKPSPPVHDTRRDEQSLIYKLTQSARRLVEATKDIEVSVHNLQVSVGHADDDEMQVPSIEQFSLNRIRNKYHRILFSNMLKAITNRDSDSVSEILILYKLNHTTSDLNWRDVHGNSILHVAAKCGDCEIVQLLIEAGADPDAQNKDLNTCLHLAVLAGHFEASEALILDGNASLEAKNSGGFTPLHIAAYMGDLGIVQLLVDNDEIIISELNNDGFSPLALAVVKDHVDVTEFLISCWPGALTAEIKSRNTILPFAIRADSSVTMIRFLLQSGCKVGDLCTDGCDVYNLAVQKNAGAPILRLLKRVLALGDDFSRAFNSLEPGSATAALIEAAGSGNVEEIDELLADGADVNGLGSAISPLHAAVAGRQKSAVLHLLGAKADCTLHDDKGLQPIQLAIRLGHFAEYQELATIGCAFPLDVDGNSLLHFAVDTHTCPNLDIVRHLIQSAGFAFATQNAFGQTALDKALSSLSIAATNDLGISDSQATDHHIRQSIVECLQLQENQNLPFKAAGSNISDQASNLQELEPSDSWAYF